MERYKIVRFYSSSANKPRRTIKTGVTLEEARAHCNNPRTRKEGVYFEGFVKQ